MGLMGQHGARQGGDAADAAAPAQVLQGVHREEREGVCHQMGRPLAHQGLPGGPGHNFLPQLEHHNADAQRTAPGVKDGDLQIVPLSGLEAHHVVGADRPEESMTRSPSHTVGTDLIQRVADHTALGQRGAGQLSPVEPLIYPLGGDVHPVGVLAVLAADFQRHHIDGLPSASGRQIRRGVGEQRNLSGFDKAIILFYNQSGKTRITSLCHYYSG